MTYISGVSLLSLPDNRGLPVDVSRMAEPELTQWAEQRAVDGGSDSSLVRFGAILFWAVVAALLLARVFIVDPAKLRPAEAASSGAASAAFHLAPGSKL